MTSKRYAKENGMGGRGRAKSEWQVRRDLEKEKKRKHNLARKIASEIRRFDDQRDGEMANETKANLPEMRTCINCGESSLEVRPTRFEGLSTRIGPLNAEMCPRCRRMVNGGELNPADLFPTYRIDQRSESVRTKVVPGFREDWVDKRDHLPTQLARVATPRQDIGPVESPGSVLRGILHDRLEK